MSTSEKRSLNEANINVEHSINPIKKRKLNTKIPENSESSSSSTVTLNKSSSSSSSLTSEDTDLVQNNKSQNNNKSNDNTANSTNLKHQFAASDFTFNDNGWCKQTSNISNISDKDNTTNKNQLNDQIIQNESTTDSFTRFQGLGFEKTLNDNSKDKEETKNNDNNNNNKVTIKKDDKEEDNLNKNKTENNNKKEEGWGGAWSGSNPDGSFKMAFNWGSWEDENAKIDLNPSTKIGYGSEAIHYDADHCESDKPAAVLNGEIDSGDKQDEIKYSSKCKVFQLENGKYIEKGVGIVNINTFKLENCDKLRSRILCRREQVLSTLINAPILKEMKFEKAGNFVRFAVMKKIENNDGDDKDDKDLDKDKKINNDSKKEEAEEEEEEDEDIKIETITYLIKPIGDKSKIEKILLEIANIQKELS